MKYLENIIPKPIFVDWAITTKCNLKCTHCRYFTKLKVKREKGKTELNNTQAKKLTKEIFRLNPNWILIEGGEPFLRKDLFSILKELNPQVHTGKHRLKKRPIFIITSGKGFNATLAKRCSACCVILMISLDSAVKKTYEKIRKGAKFNDVVRAIKIANKYNILDSINYTLQELNTSTKEINAIGKLADKYDIKKINFLGYKPNTCTVNNTSIPDFSRVFKDIQNIKIKYGIDIMVDEPFYLPWIEKQKLNKPQIHTDKHRKIFNNPLNPSNPWLQNDGPIVVEDKSGCIFGEYIFIEPDGTIKPCSFSPISIKQIGKQTIKKIQDKKNRKGKCGKCEFQLQCSGCRVRTYVMTGDWFASDPYCPL